jgi:hypothetical protein
MGVLVAWIEVADGGSRVAEGGGETSGAVVCVTGAQEASKTIIRIGANTFLIFLPSPVH